MLEIIIKMEIAVYNDATITLSHLLKFGFKKAESDIIKAGTIRMEEKITRMRGVVGPTGV